MAEKDIPLDAPPSYTSASTTAVPYTMPPPAVATTMTIVQGAELQQGTGRNDRSKYSCANPLMEVVERITRIVSILVLITFAGLAIASMTRVTVDEDSVYYNDDDDDEYEDTPYVYPAFIFVVLLASLCCTVGSLLCDIPTLIAQFISTKVMNSVVFRSLDIAKWTALSIGYVIVFILIEAFVQSANHIKAGPVITAYLVFCGITIAMGIIMAIWDCSHLFVNSQSTTTSSQVVTIVPANSIQVV